MKNVTLQILKYREAARHLWNVYLRGEGEFGLGALPDDDTLDDWTALKKDLFYALVVRYTGDEDRSLLRVVPTSPEVPAMISRSKPARTYWDNPVERLAPNDDLRFIDFFDFDQSGFLDFKYYRVAINGSERHPDLAGHEALIEVQYAHVFADDPAAPSNRT
jgi:hypothetical protein